MAFIFLSFIVLINFLQIGYFVIFLNINFIILLTSLFKTDCSTSSVKYQNKLKTAELSASTQKVLELEAKISANERKEAKEETVTTISENKKNEVEKLTVTKIDGMMDEELETNNKTSAMLGTHASRRKHPQLTILAESESINEMRDPVKRENVEETLSKELSEVQSRLERELKAAYSPVGERKVVLKSSPMEIAYLQLQVDFRDKSALYENLLLKVNHLSQQLLESGCKIDEDTRQVATSNTESKDAEQKNSSGQNHSHAIREISNSLESVISQKNNVKTEDTADATSTSKIEKEAVIAGNKEVTSLQKKVEDRTAEISLLTGRLQSMESTNSQLSDEVREKQEEKDDLMKHFETIKGKLQVKIQEGFAKTARLVEVEKERDEVTRHLAEMSVQCEELETMLRETSSEIVQVETQKLMYMGEVQTVKDELAQMVREREEERKKEDEKREKDKEDAKIREEEEEKMKERREADIRDKDIKQNDAEKERALERDEAVRSAEERRLMQLDLTEISNKLHQSLEDHRLQGERVLAMEAEKLKFQGHAEELKREIEESRSRSTALDGQLANISSALTNSEQVAIAGN